MELNEQMLKQLGDTITEKIAPMVEGVVEKAVAEKIEAVETEQTKLNDTLVELNESIKIGTNQKAKELAQIEAKEAMGGMFRKMLAGDKPGADAVLKEFSKKADYQNEGVDAEGGYLVPTEFARSIFYVAGEYGLARRLSTVFPMKSDTKNITSLTNSIVVYWTDEGIAATGSKPSYGQIQLIAYKVTALVGSTLELIDDNQSDQEIWDITSKAIGEKVAEFEDTNVFVTSTKLTGLLEDSGINSVTMATGDTSFADITYDDLIELQTAVPTKYKNGKPAYFMSQDVLKYIKLLKDTTGQPIFYPNRDWSEAQVATAPKGRLLGYDLYITDVFPDDSDDDVTTPFMLFGDMKYRAFGDRKSLSFTLGYLSGEWEKDIQSMKATQRIAGKKMTASGFARLITATT